MIIPTIILFTVISCQVNHQDSTNSSDIYPQESFAVFRGTYQNKPMIGSINLAYNKYTMKRKYPWCVHVAIQLDSITKNGLPAGNELFEAGEFEDSLIAEIKKSAAMHYIGHVLCDGFMDVFGYTDNPDKVNQILDSKTKLKILKRQFKYEIDNDPGWQTVEGLLQKGNSNAP